MPIIKTSDLAGYADRVATIQEKKNRATQRDAIRAVVVNKKFSELTAQEKDDLLKVVALRLGLVKPE